MFSGTSLFLYHSDAEEVSLLIGSYEREPKSYHGRRKIYTDVIEINKNNVIRVLQEALSIHEQNRADCRDLLEYEMGDQRLSRKKTIRPDIDIVDIDNVANQIVEFKLGYHWGQPITFIQSGDRDMTGSPKDIGDEAVALLNQMNDSEQMFLKDQELARFVEICGFGYQMVDIKREYIPGESVFDLFTLDPMTTFIVYRNDIKQTPMMSVTYRQTQDGNRYFTCFTDSRRYEVYNVFKILDNGEKEELWGESSRSGEENPIGLIPVVEYIRSADRMGVFERQIPEMSVLNTEISDFANNIAQDVQGIWWGNDFELKKDENGNYVRPASGQFFITHTTPDGKSPHLVPLSSAFDYSGVQAHIMTKRESILQKCYVPLQSDPGGGSTASAMSLSSGWSAAEAVAAKQENLIRGGKMNLARLEILAIKKSGFLPESHPLMSLTISDIKPKFTRLKTFDLGTKVNAIATMLGAGVNGRWAFQTVDLFSDTAQAWADSKETIEKIQENMVNPMANITNAIPDQGENSPIIDGMLTGEDYRQSAGEV